MVADFFRERADERGRRLAEVRLLGCWLEIFCEGRRRGGFFFFFVFLGEKTSEGISFEAEVRRKREGEEQMRQTASC